MAQYVARYVFLCRIVQLRAQLTDAKGVYPNDCFILTNLRPLLNLFEWICIFALLWRHNGRDSASNHQPHDRLLKRLFKRRSKKTPKLRVIGLCEGNSPVTGEFPAQMASNA